MSFMWHLSMITWVSPVFRSVCHCTNMLELDATLANTHCQMWTNRILLTQYHLVWYDTVWKGPARYFLQGFCWVVLLLIKARWEHTFNRFREQQSNVKLWNQGECCSIIYCTRNVVWYSLTSLVWQFRTRLGVTQLLIGCIEPKCFVMEVL